MKKTEIDWSECPAVVVDPERLSGVPTFKGTRVPISALFSNLESGATIEDFMEWFPGPSRKQIAEVLSFVAMQASVPSKRNIPSLAAA